MEKKGGEKLLPEKFNPQKPKKPSSNESTRGEKKRGAVIVGGKREGHLGIRVMLGKKASLPRKREKESPFRGMEGESKRGARKKKKILGLTPGHGRRAGKSRGCLPEIVQRHFQKKNRQHPQKTWERRLSEKI